MVEVFKREGFRIVSGGTDNHLFVVDISSTEISSMSIQNELEQVNIFVNRNKIPFDKKSAFDPSGIRMGTPAITSRGLKEKEAGQVAFLVCQLIKNIDSDSSKKEIKEEIKEICKKFPIYENFQW